VINRARAQHRPTLRPPGPFGRLCLLGILTSVALCTLVEARPVDELSGLVGTTWYTVSLLGQKIGYAYRTVEIDRQAEGGPVLRVIQSIETQLKLKGSDETLTVESLITSTYDANLQPLALTVRNNEFGRVRNISARVWNDSIEVSSESGGALTRETIQKPETFGTDLPLTLDIIRGDAKVGQTLSFDTFDPDLGKMDHHDITITEKRTLTDGREAYVLKSKSRRLPVEVVTVIAADGTLVSFATPSLLQLAVVEASEEDALAAAAPLVLSSEIETSVKIDDPRKIVRLKARLADSTGRRLDYIPSSARQSVELDGDAAIVTIRRMESGGARACLPITGEEFSKYFAPSDIFQIQDPAIVAKAKEIVGDETDARVAASRIREWVYRNMRKVRSEPRLISAREILDEMGGDCTEHSILCAALAAASGIPARIVTGIAYARGSFYYHAWNELYVGEWQEMDATWGEEAVDAGHIRLQAGPVSMESLARIALSAGRSLGSLQVEILDHEVGEPG